MNTTEPSRGESILPEVARVLKEEPEKLSFPEHQPLRNGIEKVAEIFSWRIDTLDVTIAVTAQAGSSDCVNGRQIMGVPLGAIHVTHGEETLWVRDHPSLSQRMITFKGRKTDGLAEAILAVDDWLANR